MEEEHKEIPNVAPPRFRGRLIKVMTLTLFFLIVLFSVGFLGLETTSSSKFCASCHEMKPEYYTWKASSHSEVACVNCHTGSTKEDYAKSKANGLVQVYKKASQTYTAPIQMPDEIPDSACEKCHNMNNREVTPTGDIIIPHDKHQKENVACIKCHSGVAHGKVAERKVTFKTDYDLWDEKVGHSIMSERSFVRPKMEKCMNCHESREITLECNACHTTGMYPASHKKASFKNSLHPSEAKENLANCNECHKYMSEEEITGFEKQSVYTQFLRKERTTNKKITVQDYAKENTFCKNCHTTRPESHIKGFITTHGLHAKQNQQKCLVCHDYQKTGKNNISNVTCGSCHPSSHGNDFRLTHPIEVPVNQKLEQSCYQCHNRKTCSTCHKE
ncbi:NapC/NirT family cytochrome c [Pseudoneobacillus sp. C159]